MSKDPQFVQLAEIKAINNEKLNIHKVSGTDRITAQIIAECSRKVIVFYIYILNVALRLGYSVTRNFRKQWKLAKVIMLFQPGKPLDDPASYTPISLLPTTYVFAQLKNHSRAPIRIFCETFYHRADTHS